jgi:adenylate kinase
MEHKPNIILLGPPGAGKGTISEVLIEKFDLEHISTGNIFRREIAEKTDLGGKISEIVKNGRLVSDELTVEVVTNRIKILEKGLLFDGFPRTLPQARMLDKFFETNGRKISAVVFINLAEEEILKRLGLRRTCSKCKAVYNLVSKPPKKENVCDICASELILREDDKPETVKKRLEVFHRQTEPLIEYYKANHKFFEIDGSGLPGEVAVRVFEVMSDI